MIIIQRRIAIEGGMKFSCQSDFTAAVHALLDGRLGRQLDAVAFIADYRQTLKNGSSLFSREIVSSDPACGGYPIKLVAKILPDKSDILTISCGPSTYDTLDRAWSGTLNAELGLRADLLSLVWDRSAKDAQAPSQVVEKVLRCALGCNDIAKVDFAAFAGGRAIQTVIPGAPKIKITALDINQLFISNGHKPMMPDQEYISVSVSPVDDTTFNTTVRRDMAAIVDDMQLSLR